MGSPVALPQITSLTLKIATFLVQNPTHGRIYMLIWGRVLICWVRLFRLISSDMVHYAILGKCCPASNRNHRGAIFSHLRRQWLRATGCLQAMGSKMHKSCSFAVDLGEILAGLGPKLKRLSYWALSENAGDVKECMFIWDFRPPPFWYNSKYFTVDFGWIHHQDEMLG